jgi:hypothetical protein
VWVNEIEVRDEFAVDSEGVAPRVGFVREFSAH